MNSLPTLNFWQDSRRATKDGLFPIKLVVTYRRNNKKYSTKNILPKELQYLSQGDFLASYKSTPNKEADLTKTMQKKYRQAYSAKLQELGEKVTELKRFSFQIFEERILHKKEGDRDDLVGICLEKIKSFSDTQLSSIQHYQMAINSIGRYRFGSTYDIFGKDQKKHLNKRIEYGELTQGYIEKYKQSLVERGLSTATIGIHLRALRHLFNIALKKRIIESDDYPFGKDKVKIVNGKSEKHILSITQLQKLIECETLTDQEHFAKNMWLLSFLCYGMNITDLLHLKQDNFIGKDFFRFYRRKTQKQDTENSSIKVYLTTIAREIFESLQVDDGEFSLPALNDKDGFKYDTPKKVKAKTQWIVKRINRGMKSICERLEIEKVTTYDARYTFANLAKNNAVPYNFIQECMGHSNGQSVTDSYMNAFDDDKIIEFTETIYRDLIDG